MIQRGDGAHFAIETIAETLGRNLDGDLAAHARIARAIHLSHAARANGREDLIRAEFVACRKRHMRDAAEFIQSESG